MFIAPTVGLTMIGIGVAAYVALLRGGWQHRRYEKSLKAWYREIAEPEGQAWRALLTAVGLSDRIESLSSQTRIAIRAERVKRAEPGVRSRYGGKPDVPEGFVWPWANAEPLDFLAQVALEELPDVNHGLPREGTLLFFGPLDVRVYWFPPSAILQPSRCPTGARLVKSTSLRWRWYEDIPPFGDRDDRDSREIRAYLAGEGPTLMGLPDHPAEGELLLLRLVMRWNVRTTLRLVMKTDELEARDFRGVRLEDGKRFGE